MVSVIHASSNSAQLFNLNSDYQPVLVLNDYTIKQKFVLQLSDEIFPHFFLFHYAIFH